MFSVTRYTLTKVRLLHLLEELKISSIDTGSLCVPSGYSMEKVEVLLRAALGKETPQELPGSLAGSPTGGIVFFGPGRWYLVLPPFPIHDERFSKTCEIEPLYGLLHAEFLLGLVVIRMGDYSIGVYKGEKLVSGKKGTGLVHARHRQGGSSSHRFERHRDKQIEMFFTRICGHARELLEPYLEHLDYVLYGGTRETVTEFRKQCHYLQQFDKKTLGRLLNVREPRHSGLETAIQEAWSSEVLEWRG